MDTNILTFFYLFLRLAPFIIVCFFTLASIFNQDYKGFIYLIGLIFTCFVSISTGKAIETSSLFKKPDGALEICNTIPLFQDSSVSILPLSQTIFGYTFAYMLYSMIVYKIVTINWPTFVFFTILIVSDFVWNMNYSCYTWIAMLLSLSIGSAFGFIWGAIISSTKTNNLQYFAGVNDKETCSVNAKTTFKCNVYRNGALIQSNQVK
jgi:hypothetical protein